MDGGRLALVRRVSASRPMAEVGGEPSNPLGPTRRQFGDAAAYGLTGGLTGTGYELPNFAARSRRPTFSIEAAPPLDGALCRSRTAPASRRSAFALAHATPRSPRRPSRKSPRQFLSDNRNSRYGESRARSAAYRRAARRGRDEAKIGEDAIPARPTDNPLISLETAKEKVWKSLEKFGNPRNFLGISLEKFGNPGKSLAPWR